MPQDTLFDVPVLADWQSTLAAIATTVGALSVIAVFLAALFARRQVVAARRQLENANIGASLTEVARGRAWTSDVFRHWWGDEMLAARQELSKYEDGEHLAQSVAEYWTNGDPQFITLFRIPAFFQQLAWLDSYELIEHEFASSLWGVYMVDAWDFYRPTIEWWRTQPTFGVPNSGAFGRFEEAANSFGLEIFNVPAFTEPNDNDTVA